MEQIYGLYDFKFRCPQQTLQATTYPQIFPDLLTAFSSCADLDESLSHVYACTIYISPRQERLQAESKLPKIQLQFQLRHLYLSKDVAKVHANHQSSIYRYLVKLNGTLTRPIDRGTIGDSHSGYHIADGFSRNNYSKHSYYKLKINH